MPNEALCQSHRAPHSHTSITLFLDTATANKAAKIGHRLQVAHTTGTESGSAFPLAPDTANLWLCHTTEDNAPVLFALPGDTPAENPPPPAPVSSIIHTVFQAFFSSSPDVRGHNATATLNQAMHRDGNYSAKCHRQHKAAEATTCCKPGDNGQG